MGFSRAFLLRLRAGIAVAAAVASPIWAETYQVDPVHSSVGFSIRHFVSRVNGRFTEFSGTIDYDAKEVEKSSIQGVVKAASINTGFERRDHDLRGANFFEVEKYPEVTFKSTKVEKAGDDKLLVTGELTLHGVTKTVAVPVEILGTGTHPYRGTPLIGLTGKLTLKRSEYGVNHWSDDAKVLSDEVEITVNVEAGTQAPKKE